MKKLRKISALILALVLICALAVSVFADNPVSNEKKYTYDNLIMTHEVIGWENRAAARVYFTYLDGVTAPSSFTFVYNGRLNYTICAEDAVRPSNYETGSKAFSGTATSASCYCATGTLTGKVVIDASMWSTARFNTSHAYVNHNNPDTVYVAVY